MAGPPQHPGSPTDPQLPGSHRLPAVLETSFWVAACRAEVAANCLDYFDLIVPPQVEAELTARQAGLPRREYPYATLFRQLRHRMRDAPAGAPPPLSILGPGEAAAIPLAQALAAVLLINEHRAAAYARSLAITVITVPSVIVMLRSLEVISDRAARRKLELISRITTPDFLAEAHRLLDAL